MNRLDMVANVLKHSTRRVLYPAVVAVGLAAGILTAASACASKPVTDGPRPVQATPAGSVPAPAGTQTAPATPAAPSSVDETVMEVNKAVMVTVELDFGAQPPSIAEALTMIERRYEPKDGKGRTFAILDAYGETTPDGKLHMSMHVSSEKEGVGGLVFKKNGQQLWKAKIVPGPPNSSPFAGKNLTITVDDGKGTPRLLDGSNNPATVMDAMVKDLNIPLRDYWGEGQEREVTFFYSACGCPVKVMAKRVGNKTARTKDLPVIFPDDPPAAMTIAKLMGWT